MYGNKLVSWKRKSESKFGFGSGFERGVFNCLLPNGHDVGPHNLVEIELQRLIAK